MHRCVLGRAWWESVVHCKELRQLTNQKYVWSKRQYIKTNTEIWLLLINCGERRKWVSLPMFSFLPLWRWCLSVCDMYPENKILPRKEDPHLQCVDKTSLRLCWTYMTAESRTNYLRTRTRKVRQRRCPRLSDNVLRHIYFRPSRPLMESSHTETILCFDVVNVTAMPCRS